MRVLQLISSSGFFGAENVVLELGLGMGDAGRHHAIVAVFKNAYAVHLELAEECGRNGIETVILPCRGKVDVKTILLLRRFIKDRDIHFVHSHGYKADVYAALATTGLEAFRIATCHNWPGAEYKMKLYASLDRLFLKRFQQVVAVSGEVEKNILRSGVKRERVSLIRNGIRMDRFGEKGCSPGMKKEFGISGGSVVVGTVGRLSEEKGHKILLRVAREILKFYPEVVFLLIGDGPLRQSLEREFASPSICFTGARKDVSDLYGCLDIFVLPSLTEGLPMVLLEAMASRLPVVASAVGDVPQVVKGACGILVEPGREDELRRALTSLLDHPEKWRAMGRAGWRRVRESYTSERMVQSYFRLYDRTWERKRMDDPC